MRVPVSVMVGLLMLVGCGGSSTPPAASAGPDATAATAESPAESPTAVTSSATEFPVVDLPAACAAMLAAVEPALVAGGFGTPELTGSGPEMTQITPRGGACGFNVIGGVGSLLIATYVDAGVAAEQRAAGAPGPPEFLSEVSGLGERAQVELNTDGPSSALTAWRGRERYGVGIATDDVVPPKEVLIAMVTALQALDVATLPLAKLDSFEG